METTTLLTEEQLNRLIEAIANNQYYVSLLKGIIAGIVFVGVWLLQKWRWGDRYDG